MTTVVDEGGTQIRTGDEDFADPCLTTWPCRRIGKLKTSIFRVAVYHIKLQVSVLQESRLIYPFKFVDLKKLKL